MTIVFPGRKPYEEWLPESRVRENLKHGLMRGWWEREKIGLNASLLYSTLYML